jgi:hypothetical protein
MRRLERDYFFEFAGMPQSGKTTIMKNIADILKRDSYPIEKYHGGSKDSPLYTAPIADLNLLLASNAVKFTITAISREKTEHNIYLLDKGLIDRCIFTDTLVRREKVDVEDAEKIRAILTLPRLLEKLDGVFVFVTLPEIALEREYGKMQPEPGRDVMNAGFLSDMYSIITDDYRKRLPSLVKNARIIRTDKEDERETVEIVRNNILNVINADIFI